MPLQESSVLLIYLYLTHEDRRIAQIPLYAITVSIWLLRLVVKLLLSHGVTDFKPIQFTGSTPTQIKFGTFGQNIGLLAGAFIFGNLADSLGRKKVDVCEISHY